MAFRVKFLLSLFMRLFMHPLLFAGKLCGCSLDTREFRKVLDDNMIVWGLVFRV